MSRFSQGVCVGLDGRVYKCINAYKTNLLAGRPAGQPRRHPGSGLCGDIGVVIYGMYIYGRNEVLDRLSRVDGGRKCYMYAITHTVKTKFIETHL